MNTAEQTIVLVATSDKHATVDDTRELYDTIARAWHLGPAAVLSALADIGVSGYAPGRVADLEEEVRHLEDAETDYSGRLATAEAKAEDADDRLEELRENLRDLAASWRERADKLLEAVDYAAEDDPHHLAEQAEDEGAAIALDDAAAELARLLPTGK
jgi:hypothetical protein